MIKHFIELGWNVDTNNWGTPLHIALKGTDPKELNDIVALNFRTI